LYQYRHRYFHAQLGRFVSRDPIGYDGSRWNLYEYVGSHPSTGLDPSGLVVRQSDFFGPGKDSSDRHAWRPDNPVGAFFYDLFIRDAVENPAGNMHPGALVCAPIQRVGIKLADEVGDIAIKATDEIVYVAKKVADDVLELGDDAAKVTNLGDDIKRWLGDYDIKRNDDAGFVALSDDEKRRFRIDFIDKRDDPHVHFEIYDPKLDEFIDAGDEHRYYFRSSK
jgi:uncharacterized protein RhaS with RHS repeats